MIANAYGNNTPSHTVLSSSKQVGGTHYTKGSIQPFDYIRANDLGYFEGNVLKYITRHKYKNGKEDLLKAQHYLQELIDNYKE